MKRNTLLRINSLVKNYDHATSLGHAFRTMLAKDRAKFFNDLLKIGRGHDCNDSEIMSFIGRKYDFCYYCRENKELPKTQEDLSRYEERFYVCEDCEKR